MDNRKETTIEERKLVIKLSNKASTSNTLGRSVSAETVRRVLRKAGYNGRAARKKPLIGVYGCVGGGKASIHGNYAHKMACLNILQNNLKESADKLGLGSNFIFQQDNDPKHNAFVVKECLLYHCRNQLNTPPQSPDLNVIEYMWSHLERAVQKHQVTSKEQLKSVLQEEG
ncbi:transposable element Tcb1 transposase [Trichonephila clavipes]|nr:transposable element Tcb1 transposase [Trichonephila clavipes]